MRVQTPPLPDEVLRERIGRALSDNADVLSDLRGALDFYAEREEAARRERRWLLGALAALSFLQCVQLVILMLR